MPHFDQLGARFGVNYLPRENWWYAWAEDDDTFAEDLHQIAALGFDHVRVQCLWPLFQPNPSWVSPRALRRLVHLLDRAAENGLDVCVTVLDGWLSGFDFRPCWLADVDPFTDPEAVDAAELLVGAVARAVEGHPALWCVDVANEPNVLMRHLKAGEGEAWAARMLGAARAAAVPVTVGVDHVPWMSDDVPIGRAFLAGACDLIPVHAWPYFTGALARVGEERAWAIPDYLSQVARATAGAAGKPLWIQEVGVSPLWLADVAVEDFAERMLRRAAAIPGLGAVTWWASHDISRRFTGFDELEYGLGLIDAEGRTKPVGARVAEVVAELRDRPRVRTAAETAMVPPSGQAGEPAIVLPTGRAPDIDFAEEWFAHMGATVGPAIELERSVS
ncbi:glycoside hydrolase 5 family protein [Nonomuraea sp. CA-143628]|uniref:glycoside hydrolase 5 family protein n=1 Tax=Nonomuraea sp. CA-143628 TaxID=3239997 RepID=UPI003D8E15B8